MCIERINSGKRQPIPPSRGSCITYDLGTERTRTCRNLPGHADINTHADHARKSDRPIAALLRDLKSRGLLDDTLVILNDVHGEVVRPILA